VALPLLRKVQSLRRVSGFTLIWLPFIVITLALARAAILTFSFKRIAPILGTKLNTLSTQTHVSPTQLKRAIQISKAVQLGARNVPWVANCFPQAIVARVLLGVYRIPFALYFGLRRDTDTEELLAHAWIMSGDRFVTGLSEDEVFTPVACYTNQKQDRSIHAGR
jgi:hypothetical protein